MLAGGHSVMEMFMLSLKTHALGALSLLALASLPCAAADGDLDPDFGTGGIAYITPDLVAAQEYTPAAAIVLPDGKILVAGSLDKPTTVPFEQEYRGMLARFNADGTVDSSFGNTSVPGVVEVPNLVDGARMEGIESIVRLDDGSIIATGTSSVNTPLRGFVIKLDAEGNLDSTFGSGGVVFAPATFLHAVGIDSEGRILVAGEHTVSGVFNSTVTRLDTDGTPDDGFGDAGNATITWDGAGNSGYLTSLIVNADDSVTVGGFYSVNGDGSGNDFAIARLDSTGTLDPTFDEDGWRVFHGPVDASIVNTMSRIATTPDGGIAWTGYYLNQDGANSLILGHLDANGGTDDAFGDAATPGYLLPTLATTQSVIANGLAVQSDGKLVVTAAYFADREIFFAFRSTADGAADASFGDGGAVTIDLAPDGTYSESDAVALQPDGRIVVAGRAERSDQFQVDLGVVRLLSGGGEPADRIFASGFDP
jgi:uncharacterized delta-60 repeat protein